MEKVKTKKYILLSFIYFMMSCSNTDVDSGITEIDKVKPSINLDFTENSPKPCSQIRKGETLNLRALFNDDISLKSYAIDIHNNFDHHTDDNYAGICDLEPIKIPISPYIYTNGFNIDKGLKTYETNLEIHIPDNIDTGDYHLEIRVTDAAGWQTRQVIGLKIIK